MLKAVDLPYPPRWMNAYIFAKLAEYEDIGVSANQDMSPIFASTPTNVEEVYANLLQSSNVEDPLLIQYDRMIRFRPTSFYPIKREQILYYIYSVSMSHLTNATAVIQQLLDREDASAEDLNIWTSGNSQIVSGEPVACNVFFHTTKAFQTDEPRTVQNLISSKTLFVSKLLVEYDFHNSNGSTFK
jgi:hypothetical protein